MFLNDSPAITKNIINIDDSLDVFAVHGVGGATGTLLVAILISPTFGGIGLGDGVTVMSQLGVQATGILATLIWCVIATLVIVNIARVVTGFRVEDDDEVEGLDFKAHGETGYIL